MVKLISKYLSTFTSDGLGIVLKKLFAKLLMPYKLIKWQCIKQKVSDVNIDDIKVSVVIPCYQYGVYLEEAINSILSQTAKCKVTIVIVDDGSTDEHTINVINKYEKLKADNIKVVHQPNKGASSARNRGVLYNKAKYICFLDADDKLHPEFLEKTLRVLEGNLNIDIAYTYACLFGDICATWTTEDLSLKTIKKYNYIPATAVYRTEIWEELKGYDEAMIGGYEDWDFWIRCAQKGYKGYAIPEKLFYYRKHCKSLNTDAQKRNIGLKAYINDKIDQRIIK